MPAPIHLTLACNIYDRSQPILDGTVQIEGCDLTYVPIRPEEAHLRAFTGADFDITEMSLGSHLVATAHAGSPYLGLPVFISRAFRHSCIYVRRDRGIEEAQDLRGKVVGVPEYQMTAAIWVRGILSDDFGVRTEEIAWRTGGLNQPGRKERMALDLPKTFDVRPIGDDISLSNALANGDIDAIVTARAPACFERGDPTIGRLFADYRAREEDYFRRTRIFPVIHCVGLRRDLAERHRWLARSAYKAFLEAKIMALAKFREMGSLSVSHPWIADESDRLAALMGADFWPYGIEPNRSAIETLVRYAQEQGLIGRAVAMEELFIMNVSDKPFAV